MRMIVMKIQYFHGYTEIWYLLVCSFKFNAITFIQADTEIGQSRSYCSFSVSACMYVMIQNAYKQVPKTGFIQNISEGKERAERSYTHSCRCHKS